MARSIAVIKKQIVDNSRANTTLYDPSNPDPKKRGLTSDSRSAFWNLIIEIVAVAINLLEQLQDIFKTEVESVVALASPGTPLWVQSQVLKFQWSATNDQIIQFNAITFAPGYPVVNTSMRVVKQCAVTTTSNKTLLVKVAGAGLVPISGPQEAALSSYLDHLNFAGVAFEIRNVAADFLMLGADVYYDGQYSASISTDVQAAIVAYLATANTENFDGRTTLSKLEDVIQSVPGVTDVLLRQVEARQSTVVPALADQLVNNYQKLIRVYNPYAGYMIIDTAINRTLADTLTFLASN